MPQIFAQHRIGRVLGGDQAAIEAAVAAWQTVPVDYCWQQAAPGRLDSLETTLAAPFSATGASTYTGKASRTLNFLPSSRSGWWFDRVDQPDQLPIQVSVRNVWTTARSIVLRSGGFHNYMRMVEHIIALRLGLGLDNVLIQVDSGDPPLFDNGSQDLVEGVMQAGIVPVPGRPLSYYTVREPVTFGGSRGDFLTLLPAAPGQKHLLVDCAIDFPNAIGQQRIQVQLDRHSFRHGASARTNCTLGMMLYCKTIGKLFADVRNLGYNRNNILIAGRKTYFNTAKLVENGKSLEAVWHRTMLDLVAALSLLEDGRLAGTVVSYKAGHSQDVQLVTKLYQHDLLVPVAEL